VPTFSLALHNRGLAAYMQGETADAVSWYRRSLQTPDSSNQMCWNNMGIALKELGRNAEASHSFASAKDPRTHPRP
jgi:Flp pilus assembly protein TadD